MASGFGITGTVYGTEKVEAHIKALPDRLRLSLLNAMRTQWFALQSLIVRNKLSGQVLKRQTGVLASSINAGGPLSASELIDQSDQIIGRVGTKVWYGAVHEFGGKFTVKAHQRTISQVFGRPVAAHKVDVKSYSMTVPERSFLRSGLQDISGQMRNAIAQSIKETL